MNETYGSSHSIAGVSESDSKLDALIRAEQVSMLYRQLPISVGGNMVGALVLTAAFIGEQPPRVLQGWLACVTLLQGSRLALYFWNRRTAFIHEHIGRAAFIWAAGAGISGALWGATALLFFAPEHPIYQALLTVLVFGITAAAAPLIGSHMPSFYAFVLPALIPFIARSAYVGDGPHVVFSIILFAVMLGLVSLARGYNRMLTESLRNRFEKQALAEQATVRNVELERARAAAEQANRSKTQFFAAASHDLRQPLHALGLFAAALTQKVREPEAAAVVASINASVQALETLFNELLDISKIDSGVIKPQVSSFELRGVFDRLQSEFAAEAAANGLQLTMSGGRHVVSSDPVLLERIIRNLISNAIRYTPVGAITVTATPVEGAARIEVRDTGIGIGAEDQPRVFEEFFQLGNPARTSKKGLGLGLSIVKRLCELLGYSIRLSSEIGKGSTFSFDVPLGILPASRSTNAAEAVRREADLAGRLLVVIDDEMAVVEGMKTLLTGWGVEVIGSVTGDDVIAAVHEAGRMPDLLIVDFRLGGAANGIEVAQRIREELDPEIPAFLITGSITPELAAQARAADLEFLLKPVTADALRERIGSALKLNPAS